jgi:hypothetical protein
VTRIYSLHKLDEAEIVIARRRGKRCGRACDAPIAYRVRSTRRIGRGRGATRIWHLCAEHAKAFALTHPIVAFVK